MIEIKQIESTSSVSHCHAKEMWSAQLSYLNLYTLNSCS